MLSYQNMKKSGWLKDIKVLVWDVDGTLYQEIPEVKKEIHKKVIQAIVKAKSIAIKQAKELHYQLYKQYKSNTSVLLQLGVDKDYVLSGDWYSRVQLKYLEKDNELIKIFQELKSFKHIISTNSEKIVALKKLEILGINPTLFEKIFTNKDFGVKVKPNPYAFKLVLELTKLKPQQHLFIGDSEEKEMIPAQKVGMHTCLVWGKSKAADISLPTVYDISKLFTVRSRVQSRERTIL